MPRKKKKYSFAEGFYSLQGEGHRKGTANVFLRFAGCNLQCTVAEHGFDCDTDFQKRVEFDEIGDILEWARSLGGQTRESVIFTGGEPGLQLDDRLVDAFRDVGWYVAVETNGMFKLPAGVDWVSCSPKPGTELKVTTVDEFRFVLSDGQEIPTCLPSTGISHGNRGRKKHVFVSPAFDVHTEKPRPGALLWCITKALEAGPARLSVQDHKLWGVR